MDEKEFDYLNVIPLVDVMLVLLTIVLTTSTFIATGGIKVALPKAAASEQATAPHPLTIAIDPAGAVWVENTQTTLAALATTLATEDRNRPIMVRADKTIALQRFVEVYQALRGLGFTTLSLQTEQQP